VVRGRKVLGVDEEQVRTGMNILLQDLVNMMLQVTVERVK
jgi:hypothetical protein